MNELIRTSMSNARLTRDTLAEGTHFNYNLRLEVIRSDCLTKGKIFNIDRFKIVNKHPVKKEGRVNIGGKAKKRKDSSDIIVSKEILDDDSVDFMYICFNPENERLQLVDLGGGGGIYIPIEINTKLELDQILHHGGGHFHVKILGADEKTLKIEFLDGIKEGQDMTFVNAPEITLGRGDNCTIPLKDEGVSRIQCRITRQNDEWFIEDGDGSKKSTNGTWSLVQSHCEVHDGMMFKVNNTVFRITFVSV
jgi:hypothetical protein